MKLFTMPFGVPTSHQGNAPNNQREAFPMTKQLLTPRIALITLVLLSFSAFSSGISVDAGLTPAEGRWIVRNQLRIMQREDDPAPMDRKMTQYVFNNVVAYGVRRDLTLMARQPVVHREMTMGGSHSEETGLADLFVMSKFRLYRRNTPESTIGLAGTLGLELPTGEPGFTSGTWDICPGLFASVRKGRWSSDMSAAACLNGIADENAHGVDPGDSLSVDWALGRQFSIGQDSRTSITPVVELSYRRTFADRLSGSKVPNTGESVFLVSPGVKFTRSSFILEGLVQIPVEQDQRGLQPERGVGFLIGTRYMF
jgi:outer membrane putative beta-barrel porin/alpha-amylase